MLTQPENDPLNFTDGTRRQFDRKNIIPGIMSALLVHITIIGGLWFYDIFNIKDLGDWSGPLLVKIGSISAPQVAVPDISTATSKQIPQEPASGLEKPSSSSLSPVTNTKHALPSEKKASIPINSAPKRTTTTGSPIASSTKIPAASAEAELPPKPARVQGRETGNTYTLEFEGLNSEVGRAGAYEFITSYMPLPNILNAANVKNIREYLSMNPDYIRTEIERYWEPYQGGYIKRSGAEGIIPLANRPRYWSILENAMDYKVLNAEWKISGMRPVVVEFLVLPSEGARGAQLTDFKMISRTNNPRVDEAIQYGLSRWVYYNNTKKTIRGRITYVFES